MKLNVAVFTNPNRADNTISTSTHLQSYLGICVLYYRTLYYFGACQNDCPIDTALM